MDNHPLNKDNSSYDKEFNMTTINRMAGDHNKHRASFNVQTSYAMSP